MNDYECVEPMPRQQRRIFIFFKLHYVVYQMLSTCEDKTPILEITQEVYIGVTTADTSRVISLCRRRGGASFARYKTQHVKSTISYFRKRLFLSDQMCLQTCFLCSFIEVDIQ